MTVKCGTTTCGRNDPKLRGGCQRWNTMKHQRCGFTAAASQWTTGKPPKDGKRYLLGFGGGVVSSGRYRYGSPGEPQQEVKGWRCDCCGRFGTPKKWSEMES